MSRRRLLVGGALLALLLCLAPVGAQDQADFIAWDWAAFSEGFWWQAPDPLTLTPPPVYQGDLPALPLDLSQVAFVEQAGLNEAQRALLAQNGFVVVPAGLDYFDQAYVWDQQWRAEDGTGWFVTTDAVLHTLHFVFQNVLSDLEKAVLVDKMATAVGGALEQARQQAAGLDGAAQTAALNAASYLSVAQQLFSGEITTADPVERQLIEAALAADGQLPVPFLAGYIEDFSQYRPRAQYAGDEILERYFRGMMWVSRLTFAANDADATLTALLLLRALQNAPQSFAAWQDANAIITFLIGQADDLGPNEYRPLAEAVFGAGLPLAALADPARLADFQARVKELPGPRINGLFLPPQTAAADISELARGFRLMGQRFTLDANVLQQVMDPYIRGRALPSALDVAAAMGSDEALTLALAAGADQFADYAPKIAEQRTQLEALGTNDWLRNVYGGWLWTLDPLWQREAAPYPPLMNTEAWRLKDLHTGLASYTQLKHDTVLYTKPPGGLGGGGELFSYGYVEPNPLVFARIAVVSGLMYEGLRARGLTEIPYEEPIFDPDTGTFSDSAGFNLRLSLSQLPIITTYGAKLADMANRSLRGEPYTEDEYMLLQGISMFFSGIRMTLQDPNNPEPVALVVDIANDYQGMQTLQQGVGGVDYIYTVVTGPKGLQVTRGGVFSYYEFTGDLNNRLTDQEWRAQVKAGDLPPRPAWTGAFIGQ